LFCLFTCSFIFAESSADINTAGRDTHFTILQSIDRISREVTVPTSNRMRTAQLSVNLLEDQNEPEAQEKGWIQTHGTLSGALVGFGGGWAIGYAGGDDGLINDGGKGTNGLIGGGIGAAVGAVIGKFAIH